MDAEQLGSALLAWYDRERRDLPWRAARGHVADPYRVWVSEVMLQQTTVTTVIPFFLAFMERWPTIPALASAKLSDVLHAWQGLGYYTRARHLHAGARLIVEQFAGRLPSNEVLLQQVPGIGKYTSAAIAAIAFGQPATAVDGNVAQVIARLYRLEHPLPSAITQVTQLANRLVPRSRPGDFAQAMMDLGAVICRPRQPRCTDCCWVQACAAARSGCPEKYPRRSKKGKPEIRFGVAFWLRSPRDAILLRRRPITGLLGGMFEIPSTPWRQTVWPTGEALKYAPVPEGWLSMSTVVEHVFSHFRLRLSVMAGIVEEERGVQGLWCPLHHLDRHPLPTLMRKVIAVALAEDPHSHGVSRIDC